MLPTPLPLHLTQPARGFLRAGVTLVTDSRLGLTRSEPVEKLPLAPTTAYYWTAASESSHSRYCGHETAVHAGPTEARRAG